MYKIQEVGRPETAIWLTSEETVISNDGIGDLHFDSTSPDTAKFVIQNSEDKLYLADMTFNQPLFINESSVPAGSKRQLKHGDHIQIGNSSFEIISPQVSVENINSNAAEKNTNNNTWKLQASGNWLDGQIFKINGKVVIGRDASCDITIPGSHLSRRHVEFIATKDKLLMRDLDSSNGCFVNGKRCKVATLSESDKLVLDVLPFKIIAPLETNTPVDERRTVMMNAIKLPESDTLSATDSGEKSWKTKPTSIGNRENDSLDIILAEHQRNKKIIYTVFGSIVIVLCLAVLLVTQI